MSAAGKRSGAHAVMTRLLLTTSPSVGHTLPVLAIGRAARSAGDEVAVLTAGALAGLVAPLPMLAAGPDWDELREQNARRHPGRIGSVPEPLDPSPADAGDFFSRTRLELAADEADRVAREFAPDVIVAEAADSVGPFLAASLGVPWAVHGFGTELPGAYSSPTSTGTVTGPPTSARRRSSRTGPGPGRCGASSTIRATGSRRPVSPTRSPRSAARTTPGARCSRARASGDTGMGGRARGIAAALRPTRGVARGSP